MLDPTPLLIVGGLSAFVSLGSAIAGIIIQYRNDDQGRGSLSDHKITPQDSVDPDPTAEPSMYSEVTESMELMISSLLELVKDAMLQSHF